MDNKPHRPVDMSDSFKENGWDEMVSMVTRAPRGDKDVEYDFASEEEWQKQFQQGNLINTNQKWEKIRTSWFLLLQ